MRNRLGTSQIRMLLAGVLGLLCLTPPVQQLANTPEEVDLPLGQHANVPLGLAGYTKFTTSNRFVLQVDTTHSAGPNSRIEFVPQDIGVATVSARVFGVVPWKSVRVHVVPPAMVYVGGQSIGIRLRSPGAMIVGFQRLGSQQASPAAEARLHIGDVIEQVDDKWVKSVSDIRNLTNQVPSRGAVTVRVKRGDDHVNVVIRPFTDTQGLRHLGVFVRDKTTGVGTLTFYDPEHHRFGALGHIITDIDTGLPIEGTGSLYEAEITGVTRGQVGRPGEKRGRFNSKAAELGEIEKNTPFGVFGSMGHIPQHLGYSREYPIALPSQVHEGSAKILTVLHGQTVEEFEVRIENVTRQTHPNTKSMVVHVTDPRLIAQTGGIVQGMSGSPIIQEGRLIGAVTHVFVSDPTRGYGVYAKWMMREADAGDSSVRNDNEVAAIIRLPKG